MRELAPFVIVFGVCGAAALFVGHSLLRPQPETFSPSPILAGPPPSPLEGPQLRTVDASDPLEWRFFSLGRGSVVENPVGAEWDLAFRRFQIIVNGGGGFPGNAGVQALAEADFDAVTLLPSRGYEQARVPGDSINPALDRWYDYSFFSHLLTPRPVVYGVRTAAGEHAKLELLGYYCPGPQPGCITFRYEFLSTEP